MPDHVLGHGPQLLKGAARQQSWGTARLSSMPSLASSFRTRGLPHVGLARDILRIKLRMAWSSSGRPGLPARLFRVQKRLSPARCQPITVAG